MTNTVTPISASTVGAAFAEFLKAHATLHTQSTLMREDQELPARVFDAIGTLIDARITDVGLPIHLRWVPPVSPTNGNYYTMSQAHVLGTMLAWVMNDSRSILLDTDSLGIQPSHNAYDVAITRDRLWLNGDTIWVRR